MTTASVFPIKSCDLPQAPDLDLALDMIWDELTRGVTDRRSPYHLPCVATVTASGEPDLRTVVLRQASRETAVLRFHTDVRSGKIDAFSRAPVCALHVYDQTAKTQVRMQSHVTVHLDDEIAEIAWQASKPSSRECYAQSYPPRHVLDRPEDVTCAATLDAAAARDNFAVIHLHAYRIEVLYLHHTGHRRAEWTQHGVDWVGHWLAP